MADNFKKASKKKIRFNTNVGMLSVEQLWDLDLPQLDTLAVSLEKAYKESGGKSFLSTDDKKDKDLKLRFDIVLEVLQDKMKIAEAARKAAETKAHNQKILAIIAKKKDQELEDADVAELEAMLQG